MATCPCCCCSWNAGACCHISLNVAGRGFSARWGLVSALRFFLFPLTVGGAPPSAELEGTNEWCSALKRRQLFGSFYPLAFRKKHVSAILNIRGMTRQAERQEILNVVRDIESSDGSSDGALGRLSRDRALFSEVPVTSEVRCLNVGLSRIAITASSCFGTLRPHSHKTRRPAQERANDGL